MNFAEEQVKLGLAENCWVYGRKTGMKPEVLTTAIRIIVMAIVISVALLFLGIGFLVLIHICVVRRAFRLGFSNRSNIVERSSFGSTSMSRDDVEKLPCFDFKTNEKGSSPVDCAVCLENYKAGDKCRLLPLCRHSFHAECVDTWLLRTPICPICRASADQHSMAATVSGEESRRYSESGNEFRNSGTTEVGNLGDQGSHAAAGAAELTDEHLVIELRESQFSECGCLNENSLEDREMHRIELNAEFDEVEARQHQTPSVSA